MHLFVKFLPLRKAINYVWILINVSGLVKSKISVSFFFKFYYLRLKVKVSPNSVNVAWIRGRNCYDWNMLRQDDFH